MQIYTSALHRLKDYYPENEAKAIARLVFAERYSVEMRDIYMGKDITFSPDERADLENILSRLCKYEPVQYVLERAVFCGMPFHVAPGVLIPRPETEELVAWILNDLPSEFTGSILDIGTGSGCIAIALSAKLRDAEITSCDISDEALDIARKNNTNLGTNVKFSHCDILHEMPAGKYDVIVSNPPYICPSEKRDMDRNVLDWEPESALFVPEDDPLLFYRRIADLGNELLLDEGSIYFEINQAYGNDIVQLLKKKEYKNVQIRKDFYGNNRMVKAIK